MQSPSERLLDAAHQLAASATPAGNISAQIDYWKHGITLSMHFNDMCIRLRVLCLTVLATFFAAAAVSMAQYPNGIVSVFAHEAHISAALYAIAIIFVSSLWLLDQSYYYQMLLASVKNSEQIEHKVKDLVHDLIPGDTITHALTRTISRAASRSIANIFYGVQVGLACLMLVSAWNYERPAPAEVAKPPQQQMQVLQSPQLDLRGTYQP